MLWGGLGVCGLGCWGCWGWFGGVCGGWVGCVGWLCLWLGWWWGCGFFFGCWLGWCLRALGCFCVLVRLWWVLCCVGVGGSAVFG
ncbi:hypothetical protein RA266_27815, partial [Pseudomonas syringae pv. tagetis]|uniref:hypothetical protein n=1 Tax=Pseudomonas syringae group genomosp. 7 TaxID=251699 RepID=UPI00376F4E38